MKMHITTDYIVAAVVLFSFYRGWRKGFLKTLLGPASLIAGCVLGYVYYGKTQNMVLGLLISVIGPFFISILAGFMLNLWHKAVDNSAPLSPVSQISAGAISVLWSAGYLAAILLLLALAPVRLGWFQKIQQDVLNSKSYSLLNHWLADYVSLDPTDVHKLTDLLKNPEKLKAFESSDEFRSLTSDPRLKELLEDEETAGQIQNKDYMKLIANPKMQAVLGDKELLRKFLTLNQKIMKEGAGGKTAGGTPP